MLIVPATHPPDYHSAMTRWLGHGARRVSRSVLAAYLVVAGTPAFAPQLASAQTSVLAPGVALATFDTAWSRIDQTYFDTVFLSTRWRTLRDSLRPAAERATTNAELRRVLTQMLSAIETSHFGIIPREASPVLDALDAAGATTVVSGITGNVGASLRIAGGGLVVWKVNDDSPAQRGGLRPGDRVLTIGAIAVDSAVAQLASIADDKVRKQTSLTLAMRSNAMLNGRIGDTLVMRVERAGRAREVLVPRVRVRGTMSRLGNLPPMNAWVEVAERRVPASGGERRIGIVSFSVWLPTLFPQLDSAVQRFRDADGLIIDLRGNPGGLAALTGRLAGHVLDTAVSLGALHMRTTTLKLVANPQRVAPDGSTRVEPFAGPVAILVDPLSASASEFFAAGIQGLGRARVFGDTTAGASVPALMGRLPNGDVMLHAIADHLDPRGRRVEGRGVIPDEVFELNPAAIAAGRDEPLEAAVRWISSQPRRRVQ